MFTNKHHHHIDKILGLKDKLSFIYEHLVLQAFGLSMIGIFVPVYLYSIGFSIFQVIFFVFLQWTIYGAFTPLYARVIHKIGIKEVVIIRTPLLILNLYLLYLLQGGLAHNYSHIIAILEGFSSSLYTLSISSLFAKHVGVKEQGKKTAKFFAFPKVASILAPALGGFIALKFGFPALFLIVIFLLVASLIPVFFIKENINHPPYNSLAFKRFRRYFREFIVLNGYGMRDIPFGITLPIALYLYKENSFSLGIVFSIIALASAIIFIFVGKVIDKRGIRGILTFGGLYSGAILLLMGMLLNTKWLFVLAVLLGFNTVPIAYETHLYNEARRYRSPLEFITFKEFSQFIGRTIFFAVLFLVTMSFNVSFYLGALVSLVFLLY